MTSTSQYEAFFDDMDADGSGKVTKAEARAMLGKKGHSESQIQAFFDTMDTTNDDVITKTEFMTAMGCATPEQMKEAAMRRAFNEYDADGSGQITKAEMKKLMEEVFEKEYSAEECEKMMELSNAGDDDQINYEEFISRFYGQ